MHIQKQTISVTKSSVFKGIHAGVFSFKTDAFFQITHFRIMKEMNERRNEWMDENS